MPHEPLSIGSRAAYKAAVFLIKPVLDKQLRRFKSLQTTSGQCNLRFASRRIVFRQKRLKRCLELMDDGIDLSLRLDKFA